MKMAPYEIWVGLFTHYIGKTVNENWDNEL